MAGPTNRLRITLAAAFAVPLLTGGGTALAQDGGPTGVGSRFVQTQTPLTNEKGVFEASINHRFVTNVKDAGGGRLLGLDSGAVIGLGMDYTFIKSLAFQLYRSENYADYEFALKWTALRPTQKLPLAIGLRGGLDWATADYLTEKYSAPFCQLLLSATIADRVTIAVSPGYAQRSPAHDEEHFNVPINLQVNFTKSIAAIAEYVPKKSWSDDSIGQWSVALQKSVYHHRFALWIGNTRGLTMDQILGSDIEGGGDVKDKNIKLGFNVMRSFDIATD